jgi:addiction module RelE/StbE family toxin
MRLRFSPKARRDIIEIRRHIARDRPSAAKKIAQKLLDACSGLRQFPYRGRIGKKPGTRELTTVWPYVIVYQVEPDEAIIIDSVWHVARER